MNPLAETTQRALKRPLMIAMASLALSAAVFVGINLLLADRQASLEGARRSSSDATQQLRNVQEENRALERSLSEFQSLRQRRVIGSPQRLDWTEQLLVAGQPLLDFEYRFAPTTSASQAGAPGSVAPLYQTLITTSEFKATLRHEVELLLLLDKLERGGNLVRTRACSMEQEVAPEARGVIHAQCQVEWITIAPLAGTSEGPSR